MILYDPLNRPILDEDECDMGTKREQFIREIQEMEPIDSSNLNIMISPHNQDILDELFQKRQNDINLTCDEMQKQAKENADPK